MTTSTPRKINKYRKLPNTPTTMLRNIVASKAAIRPADTFNSKIVAILIP